jgi:hypothetical protein
MDKQSYIGFVYEWTNNVNGKKYIGKHKGDEHDGYIGNGKYFLNAYNRYGAENFTRVILEYVYGDETDLSAKEEFWLIKTGAPTNDNYYNISASGSGGNTTAGYSKSYISSYMKSVVDTPEWRTSQKEALRKAVCTPEWKAALTEGNKKKQCRGINNPKFRGYWITPCGKFDSQVVAAKANNIHFGTLRNRCLNADHVIKQKISVPSDWYGKTWRELGWYFEPAKRIRIVHKKVYTRKGYADLYDLRNLSISAN